VSESSPAQKICARFSESLANGTFARLILSAPVASDAGPEKILGRFVMLKGKPHVSLTLRHATRDVTQNVPVAAAADWLGGQLAGFRNALVCTTRRDWQFIANETGARLIDHKPSSKHPPPAEHDRKRAGLLDAAANDWLGGLGVLDRDGKLRASMADKHRQMEHYLELFSHLAKECGWIGGPSRGSALQVADMGCGKGYLTFGLWHLVHRIWNQPVRILGVEARADLVSTTSRLAKAIRAEGLEFVAGTIESAKLPAVDALIALHACNTATDDAIRRGTPGSAPATRQTRAAGGGVAPRADGGTHGGVGDGWFAGALFGMGGLPDEGDRIRQQRAYAEEPDAGSRAGRATVRRGRATATH
jgi:hypothetical protein